MFLSSSLVGIAICLCLTMFPFQSIKSNGSHSPNLNFFCDFVLIFSFRENFFPFSLFLTPRKLCFAESLLSCSCHFLRVGNCSNSNYFLETEKDAAADGEENNQEESMSIGSVI